MNNWVTSIDDGEIYSDVSYSTFEETLRSMERDAFASIITRFVSKEKQVLETGCGMGFTSFYLAREGYRVNALDISFKILKMLKRFAEKEKSDGRICSENLSFLCTDLIAPGIRSEKFDLIFNHGVYEHFLKKSDRQSVLSNLRYCLAPNGILIIAVPNLGNPLFKMSIRRTGIPEMIHFSLATLRYEMEAEGFALRETGGLFVGPGYREWVRSSMLNKVIGVAGLVWHFMPPVLRHRFGAHLYIVCQKIT